MPPKKKDGGGKAVAEEVEPDEEEKELIERELVISYLKSKLGRYQYQGERLQVENIKLTEELENQKVNLRDINEFLTNELKARSITTTALEEKVGEMDAAMEKQRDDYEAEISRLKEENDRALQKLETNIHEYEKKMKGTQEFLDKKEQLESELSELKEKLERKTNEFEKKVSDMERQHIQDKEKWKREMTQKIKETKTQMMKLTDNQLEITTKRTIMENEQMSSELAYQSRQTEKLLHKNQLLFDENADMRRQMDLAKQTQEELAKRNFVYQKTIRTLLDKMKYHEVQKNDDEGVMVELGGYINQLESQAKDLEFQLEEQRELTAHHQKEAQERQAEIGNLECKYDEGAKFLIQCMEDVKEKIVTVVSEEREGSERPEIMVLPGQLEELSLEQRERVLAFLISKFHMTFDSEFEEAIHSHRTVDDGTGLRLTGIGPDGITREDAAVPPLHELLWPVQPLFRPLNTIEGTMVSTAVQTQPAGLGDVSELTTTLLGSVRPWGNKSTEQKSTAKTTETFLKKGTAKSSLIAGQ